MINVELKSNKNGVSSEKRGKSLEKSFAYWLDIQNISYGEHASISHTVWAPKTPFSRVRMYCHRSTIITEVTFSLENLMAARSPLPRSGSGQWIQTHVRAKFCIQLTPFTHLSSPIGSTVNADTSALGNLEWCLSKTSFWWLQKHELINPSSQTGFFSNKDIRNKCLPTPYIL